MDPLPVTAGDDVRRFLRTVTEAQGARLTINGQSLLNFSSNNYLGLARHPQVIEAVKEVLDHWGAGATSSRLISGSSIIHQDLENALAAYLHKESALVFPTGYQANLGVVTTLVGPGDAVVMDRLCHASIVDAVRLSGARLFVYKHTDVEEARRALERAGSYPRRLLITESLFSMDGDFAPLDELLASAKQFKAISVVDDAHALGVWDTPTEGWDVVIGTLSKSLGSQGGFVAGSAEIIDKMINKARSFIYTTGLSPACVAAAHAALSLIQEEGSPLPDPPPRRGREKEVPSPISGEGGRRPGEGTRCAQVQELSSLLRNGLRDLEFDIFHSESQIIPILLGDPQTTLSCAGYLMKAGIYAPAIRPPTVHAGECRIRFSVTAEHSEKDVNTLLSVMKDIPLPSRERVGEARERVIKS